MGKEEIFGLKSEYGNGGVMLVVWSVKSERVYRYKFVCNEGPCAQEDRGVGQVCFHGSFQTAAL